MNWNTGLQTTKASLFGLKNMHIELEKLLGCSHYETIIVDGWME
jgi:hypothetical protein